MKIRTSTYQFGLIIPKKSGITWIHQCDGYCCNQLETEGIFVPLDKKYFEEYVNDIGDTEYFYDEENLPFNFELIPERWGSMKEILIREGYEWIRFLGWKNKVDPRAKEWDKLIGKELLLIYPNSD